MTAYTYIDTIGALDDAVRRLSGQPILGVDIEASGYHRYLDRVSLIQISSRDETVLIDPLAVTTLDLLDDLFSNARIEKVFHDADFDLRSLDRDLGLRVSNIFDTQIAAAFLGVRGLGLGAVIETYLGVTLPKAFQRADWAARPLSDGMKEYAATDTAYLPALRDALHEALVSAGRLAWAQEEFARREETRWVAPDSAEVADTFLRIKGARDLPPRALAILREVHAWREQVAEERDQAPFRILSNEALLQMGREAPTTIAGLRKVRGVSGGLADRRGRDVLAAIERGLAAPEADLPRFPQPKRWDRDADVEARAERLRAVRARVAEALNLDPGFLVSRAVLDEIARQNPASADELAEIPGIRRWQLEVLADDLLGQLGAPTR
jgi:ribonuclease D